MNPQRSQRDSLNQAQFDEASRNCIEGESAMWTVDKTSSSMLSEDSLAFFIF